MPFAALKLNPGVNAEYTPTLNEAGISDSQLIRFKDQLPQKIGGWERFYNNAVSGITRALHGWGDLAQVNRLAVGTTDFLGTINDGTLDTLTPQELTTNPAEDFSTISGDATVVVVDAGITDVTIFDAVFFNTPISVGGLVLHGLYPITVISGAHSYSIEANANATSTVSNGGAVPTFTTTSSSAIVTVTLIAHGLAVENDFTFPIATTVGGIIIDGTYNVISTPTADTFTIGATTSATSGATVAMNGGDAQLRYYLSLGPAASGVGFGLGGFGLGGFGLGDAGGTNPQTGDPITATNWSLDNWGEFLMACPANGGVYFWPPKRGYTTAFLVATAPPFNGGIFVAMPAQILVAWGSTAAAPGTTGFNRSPEQRDPLIVRWSDQEDFSVWTPTSLTQAGSYRIPSGSKIIGGLQGPQVAYIWTDIEAWSMEYMGPPYIFGFNKIGQGCGLIGQHAAGVLHGITRWMSQSGFYTIEGGVQEMPCSVWDYVFQDLDTDNAHKVCCCPNSLYSEVMWEFPSITDGTGENSRYVKYNTIERAWDFGVLNRTAWIDQTVLGNPIGTTTTGLIYQHEMGNDADGAAMNSYFETGYFVVAEGSEFPFIDMFLPDMRWGTQSGSQSAVVKITITARDYPNGTERSYGPFPVSTAVTFVTTRLRGRQIKFRVESDDLGSFWRLGKPTYRVAQDGRR